MGTSYSRKSRIADLLIGRQPDFTLKLQIQLQPLREDRMRLHIASTTARLRVKACLRIFLFLPFLTLMTFDPHRIEGTL